MTAFDRALAAVLAAEGGYTAAPSDPGNWTGGKVGSGHLRGTKYGISAAAFPTLDIANITVEQAGAIYRAHYWNPIAGDSLPPGVALVVFDGAVNQGLGAASRILQAAVGVTQDGAIGPITLRSVLAQQPSALIPEIAARRAVRYAAGDMAMNGLGWMRRLMTTTAAALAA